MEPALDAPDTPDVAALDDPDEPDEEELDEEEEDVDVPVPDDVHAPSVPAVTSTPMPNHHPRAFTMTLPPTSAEEPGTE